MRKENQTKPNHKKKASGQFLPFRLLLFCFVCFVCLGVFCSVLFHSFRSIVLFCSGLFCLLLFLFLLVFLRFWYLIEPPWHDWQWLAARGGDWYVHWCWRLCFKRFKATKRWFVGDDTLLIDRGWIIIILSILQITAWISRYHTFVWWLDTWNQLACVIPTICNMLYLWVNNDFARFLKCKFFHRKISNSQIK